MLYNSVHKLGDLYDTIYYARKHLALDRSQLITYEQVANYWYKMGAYLGLIVYTVLYTPAEGLTPEDPLNTLNDETL
jgi:hypothetical protein